MRAATASIAVTPGTTAMSSARHSAGPLSIASQTAAAMANTPGSPPETTRDVVRLRRHASAPPAARASSSRLSEAWRVWSGAQRQRGRDRARSRKDRVAAATARCASGVTCAGSPGPSPITVSRPLIGRRLPARHQHHARNRARRRPACRQAASSTAFGHGAALDIDGARRACRPRSSARRIFGRLRPTFMITAASVSAQPARQLALAHRAGQHRQHVVALDDRHAGRRPAAGHGGDAGDDLGREARRQPHMQMHVGAVEQRIAFGQHGDHRAAGFEMLGDRVAPTPS